MRLYRFPNLPNYVDQRCNVSGRAHTTHEYARRGPTDPWEVPKAAKEHRRTSLSQDLEGQRRRKGSCGVHMLAPI